MVSVGSLYESSLCKEHRRGTPTSADLEAQLEVTPVLVVGGGERHEVLLELRESSSNYHFVVLDGRFYKNGKLLNHLLAVERDETCLIVDFWQDDLIEKYQVEEFQAWLVEFIEQDNRIVLGLDEKESLGNNESPIPRSLRQGSSLIPGLGLGVGFALALGTGAAVLIPVGMAMNRMFQKVRETKEQDSVRREELPMALPDAITQATSLAKLEKWKDFLVYLSESHPMLRVECESLGVDLEPKSHTFLQVFTSKRIQPEDFAALLFRPSDLRELFPEYQAEVSPAEFLERQFQHWSKHGECQVTKRASPPSTQAYAESEVESPLPVVESPIRRLYQQLIVLDPGGPAALELNLMQLQDYKELYGAGEARFCEWVYTRLLRRGLVDAHNALLRSSDLVRLCEISGLKKSTYENCDPRTQFKMVLNKLGVLEPEVPAGIDDGVEEIRAALILGKGPSLEADSTQLINRCRIGMEKLLQMLVIFHRDAGLESLFTRVINEQLHDFKCPDLMLNDTSVRKATSGVLNRLLYAASCECEQSEPPPYLLKANVRTLWGQIAFERADSLIQSLNKLLHNTNEAERTKEEGSVPKRVEKFLQLIDDRQIRLPTTTRFFRRYEDSHGTHYEGIITQGGIQHIHFFEVQERFELNRTYLYLAATNPSAVDMVCIPMPEFLIARDV